MTGPFRPAESQLPPAAFRSFELRRPLGRDFWRSATCEQVQCDHWKNGWKTHIDVSTDLGREQARYVIKRSGRQFELDRQGTQWMFTFPAGQQCFRSGEHRMPRERDPIFVARDGDHRGNPTGRRRIHAVGADWMNDLHEHVDEALERRKRG